jgi:H+/Cl- antiporter ClcA
VNDDRGVGITVVAEQRQGAMRDLVAVVLAIGIAVALIVIVSAVMYDAVRSDTPGLSENATQILTGWGGGIMGVLGAYLGFRAGDTAARRVEPAAERRLADAPRDDT